MRKDTNKEQAKRNRSISLAMVNNQSIRHRNQIFIDKVILLPTLVYLAAISGE
jgi:hypothetical protein